MTTPACHRATWRGVTVCGHMVAELEAIHAHTGLVPIPGFGSYETNPGSALTGAGGGHVDLDMSNVSSTNCRDNETYVRGRLKLAYWRKPISGLWRQHLHILFPECPNLSQAACDQFPRFNNDLDNLADGLRDTGDRTHVAEIMYRYWHRMDNAAAVAAITGTTIKTTTTTTPKVDPLMSITVQNPGSGVAWPLETALWSMWTYALREWYAVTGMPMPTKWYDQDGNAPAGYVTNPLSGENWTVSKALWSIWFYQLNGANTAEHAGGLPTPEPTPPPAPFVPIAGIDFSSYQDDTLLAQWLPKVGFAIAKATEGKSFNAPAYLHQIGEIRAVPNLRCGAYHYAWPENGWQADFDHFATVAGLRVGEAAVLDFEPWSSSQPNADPATFPAYILGWSRAAKAKWGAPPLVYIPDWFVNLTHQHATADEWTEIAALPFFKAGVKGAYVSDPSQGPGDTLGFQQVAGWQWTSTPLDEDVLYVPWDTIAIRTA